MTLRRLPQLGQSRAISCRPPTLAAAAQRPGTLQRPARVQVAGSEEFMFNNRMASTAPIALICILMSGCGSTDMVTASGSSRVSIPETQLAILEKEASSVQAAHDIRRLQRAYGYYLDQAMWDEMADLFTDDGSVEVALDGVYVGKKRIREYFYRLGGGRRGLKRGQLNDHLQLQPVITVAPDGLTAKGRWRAVIMAGQFGESAFWGEGPYEVEYAKQSGVWKIAKLHWYQTFVVPYEGGWSKNKDVNGGVYVSKEFSPDRPPTEHYGVWPEVYIPPMHYKNPVAEAMMTIPLDTTADPEPSMAALRPSIAQLQHRVQRLHDHDAIENVVSMYGYYLDKQQWDLFTDLFSEDSMMEISRRGVYYGREGVRRAVELFGPQFIRPDHLHNHIQLQPLITIAADGRTARVRSRALSELGTYGGVGAWGDGVYENELVKVNGVWKIHVDHVFTTFFATYDEGWAYGARPTPKPSTDIPPAGPSTALYESLPDVYVPKYHYDNPVTGSGVKQAVDISLDRVPTSVRPVLERLTQTVTQLEDEDAIENLQRAYGFYIDKARWKDAADLFSEDATFEIEGRGVFVGKPRIFEYLTSSSPDGLTRGKLINYLQLQPIVHVAPNGKTAQGRWRFLAELGEWQKSQSWGSGVYENEYIRENGVWKIKKLHAFVRVFAPYAGGWAGTSEPDPNTSIPPFHYKHPVTGN